MKEFDFRKIVTGGRSAEDAQRFQGTDMTSRGAREEIFEEHPVRLRDYMIPTPPIAKATARQLYLADKRAPGAAFVANPRFGKTWALKYLASVVAQALVGRAFVSVSARNHAKKNPKNAVADVGDALGLDMSGKTDGGIHKVVNKLWMLTAEVRARHLILGLDEGHRWDSDEYSGLLAITNALWDRFKVRTTTFVWGQRDLVNLRTVMMLERRTDLIARFLPLPFQFKGISSQGELQQVLTAYDELSEFPVDSGWSFTRFFFPEAFEKGFRLSQYAEMLWEAFARASIGHKADLEVGMEWITMAVEHLLLDHHTEDQGNLRFEYQDVADAVEATGFENVVGTVYVPGEDITEFDSTNPKGGL